MDSKNPRVKDIREEIAVCLNSDQNQILFNNYFSQYIKKHPVETLRDSMNLDKVSFENLKIKTFCLF